MFNKFLEQSMEEQAKDTPDEVIAVNQTQC